MNERDLSEQIFKSYIRILNKFVVESNIGIDLILGAGDSGIAMVKYAELALAEFGVPSPSAVVLPMWRHKDDAETILFDNSIFLPQMREAVKGLETLNSVFFVDDEIGSGSMAKAMLNLLVDARQRINDFTYFILAENHGFSVEKVEGVKVVFAPFSQKHDGLWSLILRLPSEEAIQALSSIIPKNQNIYKYATNVLLGLPVKELISEEARFSSVYLEKAENEIPELSKLREEYISYLKSLIHSAI